MSWIRTTCWFALAGLVWLAPANAQTPQLAPPQYGTSDGTPRGNTDSGPPPNLAPPPLGAPAANDDSREYLRLLNQPANANPTSTNVQAAYQQPLPASGSPAALPLNGAVTNAPAPNNTAQNVPATYVAPPTIAANNAAGNNAPRALNPSGAKPIPLAGPQAKTSAASSGWSSFGTMLGSLAIVLGLFVVTIKLLRRGMPGAKQRLGRDVVEVLGQTPLANRQSLQVIRFGNKILLVAMSPDGCDTLTEITDPLEVDRLAGMCQQSQASSSTKSFGEMFRQVTNIRPAVSEPVTDVPASASTLAEVRARLRGGSLAAREVTHG